jgi:hypothetical protein
VLGSATRQGRTNERTAFGFSRAEQGEGDKVKLLGEEGLEREKERHFLLESAAGQSAPQLSILHLPPFPYIALSTPSSVMSTCIHGQ